MSKRENCEHRYTNGNCLFNGGFCLANSEEHCVKINEIQAYNQALEDFANALIDGEQNEEFVYNIEKIVERLRK